MDDVVFAHKPSLLDVATQRKRSAHAALGLAVNGAVAGQQTHGTIFRALKVTSQVATPGRSLQSMTACAVCVQLDAYAERRVQRSTRHRRCRKGLTPLLLSAYLNKSCSFSLTHFARRCSKTQTF